VCVNVRVRQWQECTCEYLDDHKEGGKVVWPTYICQSHISDDRLENEVHRSEGVSWCHDLYNRLLGGSYEHKGYLCVSVITERCGYVICSESIGQRGQVPSINS
jgi:hypothetical protein